MTMPAPSARDPDKEKAADSIRKDILSGSHGYRPDDFLSENFLFENLRFTRMAIRQALNQLQREGLVQILPKRGTRVRPIVNDEVRQLLGIRYALEEMVALELARDQSASLAEAQELNKAMGRIADKEAEGGDESAPHGKVVGVAGEEGSQPELPSFIDLDIQFHCALARAAGYDIVADKLVDIRNKLYVRAFPHLYHHRKKQVVQEHDRILRALRPGRGARVHESEVRHAVRTHLERSAERWQLARHVAGELPRIFVNLSAEEVDQILYERRALEEFVACHLAHDSRLDIAPAAEVCAQMKNLFHQFKQTEEGEEKDRLREEFVTHDARFHTTLAGCGGLTRIANSIRELWCHIHLVALFNRLTDTHMQAVLNEHKRILDVIRQSRSGKEVDEPVVRKAVWDHLVNAGERWQAYGPSGLAVEGIFSREGRLRARGGQGRTR
jgi:DNA-binding GntR family transcriptional regulator